MIGIIEEGLEIADWIDYLTIVLIVIIDVYYWKKNISDGGIYFFCIVFLGLVFPYWSSSREINRYMMHDETEVIDSFETFYTIFIYPVYWIVLALQIVYFIVKPKPAGSNSSDDSLLDSDQ